MTSCFVLGDPEGGDNRGGKQAGGIASDRVCVPPSESMSKPDRFVLGGVRTHAPTEGRDRMTEVPDASTFMGALAEAVRNKRRNLTATLRARYGKEFRVELENGTPPRDLYRAINRIASEWERVQLTVGQALSDVERGKPAPVDSPTEADRVDGYEQLFALSERQQRVYEFVRDRGRDAALERMREQPGYWEPW